MAANPLTLSPDQARQAHLIALRIAAWRAQNTDQPALSIASQLEADRAAIDALEMKHV